ncbi:hypothetical protein [Nocardia asteroides]|uniref:hypothetical protein n=1 Tax=Nocardia asteroides TaxID=1824 RepID=UPI001E5BCCBD|nr:hypothetical protein [Nocardia asteroides]UGT61001.1 hypothetical protein LTT61_28310 [Nocardia asteroides]
MNTAQIRLAVAELTAALTGDFDVPTVLHSVAGHARECFQAVSAAVILTDQRSGGSGVQIVAEAMRDGSMIADPRLHVAGPGMDSARDGAVAMIGDLDEGGAEPHADGSATRWADYRARARSAGLRSVRAFPITALTLPLGSVVVHADEPWGTLRPNDFGQILADLTAIALSTGRQDGRLVAVADTIDDVLAGTAVIATATGIIAEHFGLEVESARARLLRLARAHGRTPTAQAEALVAAHIRAPANPAANPALRPPPDLPPPTSIHR